MQYSIVNLSEVKENSDFRIDAEFYHPFYTTKYNKIISKNYIKFKDIILSIKNGDDFREYLENGKKYIRTGDFDSNGLDLSKCVKVKENLKSKIKLNCGDLLITRKGNYGKVDVVNSDNIDSFISSEIFHIILNKKIDPFFIKIYINSDYGLSFIERYIHGISNFSITQDSLKEMLIPLLSPPFQQSIADLVNTSYTLRQSADTLYKEAEEILLEELGLKNYQPQNKKCFVKMLSDTQEAGRIDAEYFQPKYEDVIDKIKKYKNGYYSLKDVCNITSGSFVSDEFYCEKGLIPYIRIKELNFKGQINKNEIVYLNDKFIIKNEITVENEDFVIATIGNTIGKICIIDNSLVGAIPSNNTSKISLNNKQNSLYYLLLFQSFIFQQQIERQYTQTAQPKISDNQLYSIIIPLLPQSIQSQISAKIQQSFESREKSKQLLEVAKMAVEIAIEENEEAGLKYIEENK